jgi:predicted ATPase
LRRREDNVAPLFGRDGERDRLRGLLDDACNGNGGIVLISGEAGIGKTTLAASVQGEAYRRGIPVRVGCCYELAATPPYGPWVDSDLFERWAEWVPQPPALGGPGGESSVRSQAELFEQVQGSLAAISDHIPLILVLEDLQWADPASLELLRFVSRRLDRLRILLAVTYQDDEVIRHCSLYRLLPALDRESRTRRIELRRLGERVIQELVDSRYRLPEADRVRLASYLANLA